MVPVTTILLQGGRGGGVDNMTTDVESACSLTYCCRDISRDVRLIIVYIFKKCHETEKFMRQIMRQRNSAQINVIYEWKKLSTAKDCKLLSGA